MAIISRIRKHSGLLVGLIGISIAGFVLQDFFGRNRQNSKVPKYLAKINSDVISFDQFNAKIDESVAQYKQQMGEDVNISNEDMNVLKNQVWDYMVNDMLIRSSCEKIGITVTQREMNDMFYGIFVHPYVYRAFVNPQTGQFNRNDVMSYINNFDQIPVDNQKIIHDIQVAAKEERLKSKFFNLIAKSYYLPQAFIDHSTMLNSSAANAEYVQLPYVSINDSDVKLTDKDYKKYYKEHKYLLKQEASRAIDYVVFEANPTAEDLAKINELVNEYYAEFKTEENVPDFVNAVSSQRYDSSFLKKSQLPKPWDSVLFNGKPGTIYAPIEQKSRWEMAKLIDIQNRPDSIRASQIIIAYQGCIANPNTPRTKEEAKKIADSLKIVAAKNTTPFEQLVAENSEENARSNGGDIGWMLDGKLIYAINEAIVKNNVGDFIVVESVFGYHVLHITGKTEPIRKVRAAFVYVPIEASPATTKEIYAKANRFAIENRTSEDFEQTIEKEGLIKRSAEYAARMDFQVPGISNARELVRWAYNSSTKKGDVSEDIFEFDNLYVVACLRDIREKGTMSFESFKEHPQAKILVTQDKKAEMLIEKINAAKAPSLSDLAAKLNTKIDSAQGIVYNYGTLANAGYEQNVIGTIFGMPIGKISEPIKGNSGVFIIKTDEIINGNNALSSMYRSQFENLFQQTLLQNVKKTLEDNASIKDNRDFIY